MTENRPLTQRELLTAALVCFAVVIVATILAIWWL